MDRKDKSILKKTMSAFDCGTIRFDDTYEHRTAWSCISGQTPKRISNVGDLNKDIVWLTNLDFEMSFASGLSSNGFFRRNDFLSENFSIINKPNSNVNIRLPEKSGLQMLLGIDNGKILDEVQCGADIFSRVMQLCAHIGVKKIPEQQLQKGFRDLIFGFDPVTQKDLHQAMTSSTVHFVNTEKQFEKKEGFYNIPLTIPKLEHALNCTDVLMPGRSWTQASISIKGEDEIDTWLEKNGLYVLAECEIKHINENVSSLLNFGSGRKQNKQIWLTGIELLMLSQFSDIQVKNFFIPEHLDEIDFIKALKSTLPDLGYASFSYNLMWQNIWLGLCSKKTPPPNIKKDRPTINQVMPFSKAIDKNNCLEKSMLLQAEGYTVNGYGKGKIYIEYDGDINSLAKICKKTGLIPPFLHLEEIIDNDAEKNEILNEPAMLLQDIYLYGDTSQLLETDKQILDVICQQKN